jgi:Flp pilus assembly pilin Flp
MASRSPGRGIWTGLGVADVPDMALHRWIDRIRSRFAHEEAQTMAEYAVILGVITPVIVVAFAMLADEIARIFDTFRGFFS